MIQIERYKDNYRQDMIDMILSIQNDENHLGFTLEEQPDMDDVNSAFLANGGMFWMAFEGEELIGTLGLAKKNEEVGVLKKFFVRKDKRGTGIGTTLYKTLLMFAEQVGMSKIILDTPSILTGAHKFYEKNGFRRIGREELPVHYEFPDRNCYLYMLEIDAEKNTYKAVAQKANYVDKTLLIRDLIDDGIPALLFTRPRGFGKTLAFDMLRCYFEKTEEDTSVYFIDKKIWTCGEKYVKLQGSFPVVTITFKDIKGSDWDSSFARMKGVICKEFMRHKELFTSNRLNTVEQNYLQKLQKNELNEVDYALSLSNLCHMLEKHHRSKVIVLIDEYDTPIQQGYLNHYHNEAITFMRNFLSGGIKDYYSTAFGILFGTFGLPKGPMSIGLNNLVLNSVLDKKYNAYFCFTEDEVNTLASYYGHEDKLAELREWYAGYCSFGSNHYNPWSVMNYFLNNCHRKLYWGNGDDNELAHENKELLIPEIKEKLLSLIQGETIQILLEMDINCASVAGVTDSFFSFLLVSGYLTPVSDAVETEFGTFLELKVPNEEIRRLIDIEIFHIPIDSYLA